MQDYESPATEDAPELPIVDSTGAPPSVAAEGFARVVPATSNDYEKTRLVRLVWLLVILLAIFIMPTIVGHIRYELTYNDQLAKVEIAKEHLGDLDLEGLSLASRLIAQGVGPSVVHIRTERKLGPSRIDDEGQFFWGEGSRPRAEGQGSGVIVDKEGFLVTNHHVIEHADEIIVDTNDGRTVQASVVGSDPLTDLAVLKIDLPNLIASPWGDSDDLDNGDLVWAVGSPFGFRASTTFGIVSATHRSGFNHVYQDFLQTDAAVNPGNSGGPLVGVNGHIVGINTAIVGPAYQGISFAIPSNTAREVYQRIRSDGEVIRGYLGVRLKSLDAQVREVLKLDEELEGVLVQQVLEGSPAAKGGLQPGDIILSWNGQEVNDPVILSRLIAASEIGAPSAVMIYRKGEVIERSITVGNRSEHIN